MLPQKTLPTLKRKQKVISLNERVSLERVLGFTVTNSSCLATDPNTGITAYPAGCVVVLYNPRKNKQSHIINTSKKAITCLDFTKDGRTLATGECGHQPAVRVWDMEELTQIAEFKGHKFGINVVKFSPNQKYLVSVGSQYDMMVNVWNWRAHTKVASNKVAAKVTGINFTEDGSMFITVGNRHVKFWNMDSSKSRIKETVPLKGHSGILGEQKNNMFCGVCCGSGSTASKTYTITHSGLLCEFNERRLLDKWVELRTTSACCIVAGQYHVYVGCANGIVRVFNAGTLNYLATLPRPHHLGVDVATGLYPSSVQMAPPDVTYPDTVAISLDDEACKLSCIYNDHSLYIWDVHDIRKVGKIRSFLYHSAAVWGLEMYPDVPQGQGALPPGSFLTCSSDDTIRVWNLDPHMTTDTAYKRNIYSNELLKVIYTDPDLTNIMEIDHNPAGKTDKTDTQYQETRGVRSLSISHDGQMLASGDRVGNIRIHHLSFMDQLHMQEAHDSEVLSLEFSRPYLGKKFLASTSRDRLIHIFEAEGDFDLIQTLDDHSAAITSVKFYENEEQQLSMVSCGMDKSLLFRTAQMDPEFQFVMTRHLVGKTTLYDMCLDPKQKFVATGCQDRNIRIYNLKNGKHKKSYSGSLSNDGTLIRVSQDRSGSYLVASGSDKNICIMDFFTGECSATMFGHSEIVTGVKFSNDLKHVISVSGDGCIFVWRLPHYMTEHMHNRLIDLGARNESYLSQNHESFVPAKSILDDLMPMPDNNANLPDCSMTPDYRFSVGQLPTWAKRQLLQDEAAEPSASFGPRNTGPTGRWAQRAVVKTMVEETSERGCFSLTPQSRDNFDALDGTRQVTIIADDENNCDDTDDEDFKLFSPGKKFNSTNLELSAINDGTFGVDEDDNDSSPSEIDAVVFFPSKEEDGTDARDALTNNFTVFEGDAASVAESEGTEPLSLESDEEDISKISAGDNSVPTTPDGFTFMKHQFGLDENEEFGQTIQEAPSVHSDTPNRLSISTRFLTRAQPTHLRNASKVNPTNTEDLRIRRTSNMTSATRASTGGSAETTGGLVETTGGSSENTANSGSSTLMRSRSRRENNSYQLATQSSKAKLRQTSDLKERDSVTRRSFGRKIQPGLKKEYRSTPDLTKVDEKEKMISLSPSRTTEDLDDVTTDNDSVGSIRMNRDRKQHFASSDGVNSLTSSSSSGYISNPSSRLQSAPVEKATIEKKDTTVMQPPASNVVLKNPRRNIASELTLSQAREILFDKSGSANSKIAGRRSLMSEGSHSNVPERRRSAVSRLSNGHDVDVDSNKADAGPVMNRTISTESTPPSVSLPLSKSSLHLPLKSVGIALPTDSSPNSPPAIMESNTLEHGPPSGRSSFDAHPNDPPEKDNHPVQSPSYASMSDNGISTSRSEVKIFVSSSSPSVSSQTSAAKTSELSTCQNSTLTLDLSPRTENRNTTFVITSKSNVSNLIDKLGRSPSPVYFTENGDQSDLSSNESSLDRDKTDTVPDVLPKTARLLPKPQVARALTPENSLSNLASRRRDPVIYSRSCVSPARQLNSTVTVSSHVTGSPANQMPAIPAPLTPSRELGASAASVSPRLSDIASSGQISPTKGMPTLNREAMTAHWQRAQQSRHRLLSGNTQQSTENDSGNEKRPILDQKYLQSKSRREEQILDDSENSAPTITNTDEAKSEGSTDSVQKSDSPCAQASAADTVSTSNTGLKSRVKNTVEAYKSSFDSVLQEYVQMKADPSASTEDLELLQNTLRYSQRELNKLLGPLPPDFTPYMSLPSTPTQPNLHHMFDYWCEQMCHIVNQRINPS